MTLRITSVLVDIMCFPLDVLYNVRIEVHRIPVERDGRPRFAPAKHSGLYLGPWAKVGNSDYHGEKEASSSS